MNRQNPNLKNIDVSLQLILLSSILESVSFILNSLTSQLSKFSSLVLHQKLRCWGLEMGNLYIMPSSNICWASSFFASFKMFEERSKSYYFLEIMCQFFESESKLSWVSKDPWPCSKSLGSKFWALQILRHIIKAIM